MEVVYIVSHLLITLAVLGLYGVSVYIGKPDLTLQNGILIILGYWFGAMGADAIKKKTAKKKGESSDE